MANTSPTDTFSVSALERSTSTRTCGAPARNEVTRLPSADCVLRLLDHVVGGVLQLDVVEAAVALLDLHLEAAGIADALDRRRHEQEGAAVLQRLQLAWQMCTTIERRSWPCSLRRARPSP